MLINDRFIFNFHHSWSKFESRDCLFKISFLWPDVCNHNSFTISSNRIFEKICEFTLSVWNMIFFAITWRNNNLLKERKWFIDVISFFYSITLYKFLCSLISCKINKMKLWNNNFLLLLISCFGLNIDSINRMCSATMFIHRSTSNRFSCFSFKQMIQSIFFIFNNMLR